jgi:hypothetical protein
VPVERQVFYVKPVDWESAFLQRSAPEIADLRSGAVTEKVERGNWAPAQGENAAQLNARIRAELLDGWTKFNAEVQDFNPWNRYGSFYELPGGWTAGGVA